MSNEKKNCTGEFLDDGQYSRNGILRYERIFGDTFVSTGGVETTKEFTAMLNLKPGMKVLDIGCGIGGSAFYLARTYQVDVLGVDLSSNMLAIANEHKAKMEPEVQARVNFRKLDATSADFGPEKFDIMYSRDAIMHIADKTGLYSKVFEWLKPGGQIMVSEYVHGKNHPNHPEEYIEYVKQRGYQLLNIADYVKVLTDVGFQDVQGLDKTDDFYRILGEELVKFEPTKEEFVKEFSLRDYDDLVDGWKIKLDRVSAGDQAWGLFVAAKKA